MFDTKHVYLSEAPSYGRCEITEHRAPTDKSVELLREMEKKAQEQILKSVRLENNDLRCMIHTYRETLSCDVIFILQVELNGRRLDTKIVTHEWDTFEEKMEKVFKGMSDLIANEIFNSTYKEICHGLGIWW